MTGNAVQGRSVVPDFADAHPGYLLKEIPASGRDFSPLPAVGSGRPTSTERTAEASTSLGCPAGNDLTFANLTAKPAVSTTVTFALLAQPFLV